MDVTEDVKVYLLYFFLNPNSLDMVLLKCLKQSHYTELQSVQCLCIVMHFVRFLPKSAWL